MALITIKDLAEELNPTGADQLAIDGTSMRRATVTKVVEAGRPAADQAEAEAGADATKAMTPLRTKQAIEAQALTKAGNLDGLADVSAARVSLGLGTAALSDVGSFATASQGAKADTALQPTDNLSGLSNVATARNNLGLGTAATSSVGDFATAAQGTKADTALQPGDIVTDANTAVDMAAMKALDTTKVKAAILLESGREGTFKWATGDFSSLIALDPYEAVYVKADAVAATSGAWVRQGDWFARGLVLSWAGVVADYVPGVSLGTDQAPRIQSLFYLAGAIGVGAVVADPGYYHVASGLKLPAGIAFTCNGAVAAYFVAGGTVRKLGCVLVGVGNAAKTYSIANDDGGAGYEFGGAVNNPSKAQPYTATHGGRSDVYRITDFTNGNAVGATRATPRQFSVILKFNRGCRLENITVTNNCGGNPAWGYSNPDFGDDWDVGLWGNASEGSVLNDCGAIGYWKIAGLLDTTFRGVETVEEGGDITSQLDRAERNRGYFTGKAGLSIRDKPRHTMTAVTANTIQIAWSKSHRWPTSGTCRTPSTVYTYTGLSFSGDKLTFTGVTPSPAGEAVPGEIYYDTNTFGIAQLQYTHCHFGDMSHGSNRYCVDNYFGANAMSDQSCATEISGRGIRQPVFINCTWHAVEDRAIHVHDCRDHQFLGGHTEGRTAVNQSGASLPRGTRIVHLAATAVQQSAPYVYRSARQGMFMMMSVGDTTDIGPSGPRDTEITSKYGTADGTGLFVATDSAFYFRWKDTDKPNIFLEGVQIRGQSPRMLFEDRDDGRQWEVGTGVSGAIVVRNVNDSRIPLTILNTAPDGAISVGSNFMDIRGLTGGMQMNRLVIADGVTAPGTLSGQAQIYVDAADGDLKVRFGDGVVKTIVTDT